MSRLFDVSLFYLQEGKNVVKPMVLRVWAVDAEHALDEAETQALAKGYDAEADRVLEVKYG